MRGTADFLNYISLKKWLILEYIFYFQVSINIWVFVSIIWILRVIFKVNFINYFYVYTPLSRKEPMSVERKIFLGYMLLHSSICLDDWWTSLVLPPNADFNCVRRHQCLLNHQTLHSYVCCMLQWQCQSKLRKSVYETLYFLFREEGI